LVIIKALALAAFAGLRFGCSRLHASFFISKQLAGQRLKAEFADY